MSVIVFKTRLPKLHKNLLWLGLVFLALVLITWIFTNTAELNFFSIAGGILVPLFLFVEHRWQRYLLDEQTLVVKNLFRKTEIELERIYKIKYLPIEKSSNRGPANLPGTVEVYYDQFEMLPVMVNEPARFLAELQDLLPNKHPARESLQKALKKIDAL